MDRAYTDRFCQAIIGEIDRIVSRFQVRPETIFFGGGTPTALSSGQLEFLLGNFGLKLDLTSLGEFTIEANPGSVSARKAALLRRFGVNRISLGVQSWDDDLLQLLGREHNAAQAEESFYMFREAGFDNVSIDLMFGLPGQTAGQWKSTLEKTIALQPDHVSAYCLTYEEDTDFFVRHSRGELRSNSDLESDFFQMAMESLQAAGYEQYEISNYARPGSASIHNRAYWAGHDYLGIGPSAFSTVGLNRWQNIPDYKQYTDRILAGQSPVGSMENLTPEMKRVERLALGLRTKDGIPATELESWKQQTEEFVRLGLLKRRESSFVLTPGGKCLADTVAEAFV